MKRCPECRRDYYDDTLSFCLEDGTPLIYGVSNDEPATAVFGVPPLGGSSSESATRPQIHTTDQTAIFPRGSEAEPRGSLGDLRKGRGSGTKPVPVLRERRNRPLIGRRNREAIVPSWSCLRGWLFCF